MSNHPGTGLPAQLTKPGTTSFAREFFTSNFWMSGLAMLKYIHLFVETMPFGGIGNSGIGNYYGKYGFDSLTHAKSVLVSPADVDIDHILPPYTPAKVQALSQWMDY